jgi:hypothetical protein
MNPYPKHYLAGVPQDLRLRVLDLCVHRQWHDALDLLHQNAFTQYEWYEVVWFHDHAPTELPPLTANLNAEPRTGNPEPETLTVGRGVPAEPNLNPVAVKVPKPRSKVARLPKDVQVNLNAMLKHGRPYGEIIAWLFNHGHPGFNKVNLHTWRIAGFQDWLRAQRLDAETGRTP